MLCVGFYLARNERKVFSRTPPRALFHVLIGCEGRNLVNDIVPRAATLRHGLWLVYLGRLHETHPAEDFLLFSFSFSLVRCLQAPLGLDVWLLLAGWLAEWESLGSTC